MVGVPNDNPILDTRFYNVTLPDGLNEEHTANTIAQSIYNNVDDDGFVNTLLNGIVGHRKNHDAVEIKNGYTEVNGITKRVITTKDWDVRVKWKDGTTSWVPLSLVKASNPVEMVEYAYSRSIQNEPAFGW